MSLADAKKKIESILGTYSVSGTPAIGLVPSKLTSGKVYEFWVLCEVLERMSADEGYSVALMHSTKVVLKSAPGPINRKYPYFRLQHRSKPDLEVWTDVEFMSLSSQRPYPKPVATDPGDYHELDIVVVPAGSTGRPLYSDVRIGVECKNTGYTKELLRAMLGVRRELSLLAHDEPTGFDTWPRDAVPANPSSCVLVYSTDAAVANYASPGKTFGIDFVSFPIS